MAINQKDLQSQTKQLANCLTDVKEAVESLSFSSSNVLASYKTNDIDEITTGNGTFYIGKMRPDGKWLIERVEKTSASEEDYDTQFANLSNNGTQTTYTSAWSNRLTLTYEKLSSLSNL